MDLADATSCRGTGSRSQAAWMTVFRCLLAIVTSDPSPLTGCVLEGIWSVPFKVQCSFGPQRSNSRWTPFVRFIPWCRLKFDAVHNPALPHFTLLRSECACMWLLVHSNVLSAIHFSNGSHFKLHSGVEGCDLYSELNCEQVSFKTNAAFSGVAHTCNHFVVCVYWANIFAQCTSLYCEISVHGLC